MNLEIAVPEELGDAVFSFSQLNLYDRCSFAWHLSYRLGWTPVTKKRALEFGSFMHTLWSWYYGGRPVGWSSHDESDLPNEPWRREMVDEFIQSIFEMGDVTAETLQIVDQGAWLMDQYVDWAQYADRDQHTLAVEFHFEMDFKTPRGLPYKLQGYIDHVYEEQDKVWLRDHKTFGRSPISPVEAVMDPQMPVYAIAMREHGFTPFGIEFNQANSYQYKKRDEVTPDKLFVRERTYRTHEELDAVALEVGRLVDDIYDNYANPRRSLKRDCKMCDFQEPCLMSLKGIPIEDSFQMGNWRKKESFNVQG